MIKTMSKLDDLLKLLDLKKEKNELAKTEMLFFEDERTHKAVIACNEKHEQDSLLFFCS